MYYSDAFYIYIENGGEKSIMKLQKPNKYEVKLLILFNCNNK